MAPVIVKIREYIGFRVYCRLVPRNRLTAATVSQSDTMYSFACHGFRCPLFSRTSETPYKQNKTKCIPDTTKVLSRCYL